MIGDPAFALVGEYRTKEKKTKKNPDFARVFSHAQRRLEAPVGDITVFCHFIYHDSWLIYRPGSSLSPFGNGVFAIALRELKKGDSEDPGR